MPRYRNALPQLEPGRLFVTDGGLETTLIYHDGLDLPHFAAFLLLESMEGDAALRRYYRRYAEIARRHGAGLILESATWRANADWARRLGYSAEDLAVANRRAISLLDEIRAEASDHGAPVVISGCVGPRGDGYLATSTMTAGEAEAYHAEQVRTFAGTEADMVAAITMNYVAEAVGIVRAARSAEMPVAVSWTVETDGRLPDGTRLDAAIDELDRLTDGYAAYHMINCAHPSHFAAALEGDEPWKRRILGVRANASKKSHAELDAATELDAGDPDELGRDYVALKRALPSLAVLGGCCGTDHRHVESVAAACAPLFAVAA